MKRRSGGAARGELAVGHDDGARDRFEAVGVRPAGQLGAVRVQVEADRRACRGGELRDEARGRLGVGRHQRADHRGRDVVAPGGGVAGDAVGRVSRTAIRSAKPGRRPRIAPAVRAERRAVQRRGSAGRSASVGGADAPGRARAAEPLQDRGAGAEAADEGDVAADRRRSRASRTAACPCRWRTASPWRPSPAAAQQVLHQRPAEAAPPVPRRDEHHADRRVVRPPTGSAPPPRPGRGRRARRRRTPRTPRAAATTWPAPATSPGQATARRTA